MQAVQTENHFPVEFRGVVVRVMFNNTDNGWSVLIVHPEENSGISMKEVAVTGVIHEPRCHDNVEIRGEWTYNTRYKQQQVKAEEIRVMMPETKDGIYHLLKAKGFLPGIGDKIAKAIVSKFGAETFTIIETQPERLVEIDGISKKKAERIAKAYGEKIKMKDILAFCAMYDIPQGQGKKIFEVYGSSAVTILKRNPYLITESHKGVKGIGFKKADAIAKSLALPPTSETRISHCLAYSLSELTARKGGTTVSRENLLEEATNVLEIETSLIEPVLNRMLEEKLSSKVVLVKDDLNGVESVWRKSVYEKEKYIANKIIAIDESQYKKYRVPSNIEEAIISAEKEANISLADSQKNALRNCLSRSFSVLTGGPGTGKTTIIRCLIGILEKMGNSIALAAPTGRASKRMSEATGRKASTIHRLLGVGGMATEDSKDSKGYFDHDEENPLEQKVFIIDESSMIDNSLMASLLMAIPEGCMVVLVGDVDQLPSVGAGQVLEDIIKSGAVMVSRLDTIFRQAATSNIITSAHAINSGKMPTVMDSPDSDFYIINQEDNDACSRMILKLADYLPRRFGCDRLWDVQVLSPKKASPVGTEYLNRMLQDYYYPEVKMARLQWLAKDKQKRNEFLTPEEQQSLNMQFNTPMLIGAGGNILAVGDKVMQTKNDYAKGVFNGDVGQIVEMNVQLAKNKDDDNFAKVAFPDENDNSGWRWVSYSKKELWENITLSYACTIHKSQGSEYPFVIIPMMPTFSIMLQRKLLYTGVTRGKKMVCVVGSNEAIENAVHDKFKRIVSSRKTKLKYWLQFRRKKGSPLLIERNELAEIE